MSNFTGKILQNNYFLRQHIGKGATADVYLAWDKVRHSELAVKVLHHELARDSRFINMFKKEAEFMRELRHPNIVRLFDFGEDKNTDKTTGKTVFIVMDYIKGSNLRGLLLERKAPFTIDEVSQILAAICKALYFAHQSKVLHCDVKPANILVSQKDGNNLSEKDIFLADFGISHWALQQKGGGTPAYMAPELFKGGSVTERTDIYALGVTLYEMLSGGELPFRGETGSPGSTPRERIAWEKGNKPLPPLEQFNPNLPKAIIAIVEKALNKDPKLRHTSAIEVWNEVEYARSRNGNQISDQKTIVQPFPSQLPPRSNPHLGVISSPGAVFRANQPHLSGLAGEKAGQVIPITKHGLTIGRSASNNLRFTDPSVSRVHAIISISRRAFYIQDQDSSLGTYLNGRKIPANKSILIKEGDRIEVGNSQSFIFHLNSRTKG
jgi:eukaryotic-like serine/threonine-protein kinase